MIRKTLHLKTDENFENVQALVRCDQWMSVRMISSGLNLNVATVHHMLTQDFDIQNVYDGGFQKPDTYPEKELQKAACENLFKPIETDETFFE